MNKTILLTVLLCSTLAKAEQSDQKEILMRLDSIQKEIQELRKQVETLTSARSSQTSSPTVPKPEDISKAIKEATQKYDIARKVGPSKDSCFLAKDIADFALKFSRADEYAKWRPIANKDCKAAGWPAE